jgi:hypothetical protein
MPALSLQLQGSRRRCRCGTGRSGSTVSGAGWSQPNALHCAADACERDSRGRPPRAPAMPVQRRVYPKWEEEQ